LRFYRKFLTRRAKAVFERQLNRPKSEGGIIRGVQLAFANHVHEFDASQGIFGRTKRFEAEHWPDDAPDCAMVLLNEIIQILDLAEFNLR
jgi:hypothetical protein